MSYLAYAGIGSRQTPANIISIMRHIGAYLSSEGWTLRSGAEQGADTAFEVGVDDHLLTTRNPGGDHFSSNKEIYLPWKGFNNHPSLLHPGNIPFSQMEVDFTAQYHPAWSKCSPSAKLLHQRNTRQILGCEAVNGPQVTPVKFIVCWTEDGLLKGGTAQALRIANSLDIPIVNLGSATNPQELEALVLEVDRFQAEFKKEETP